MRLLHTLAKTRASFDDPNLISHAGLVPLAALAERARLHDLAAAHVRPDGGRGANAGLKVACLAAGTSSQKPRALMISAGVCGFGSALSEEACAT